MEEQAFGLLRGRGVRLLGPLILVILLCLLYGPLLEGLHWLPSVSVLVESFTDGGPDISRRENDFTLERLRQAIINNTSFNQQPELLAFQPEKLWYDCGALFRHIRERTIRDPIKDELYTILSLAACGYEGGFIRYGDGEMALVYNRSIPADSQATLVDHFSWDGPTRSLLGERIEHTLVHPKPSIFYAVSCTRCPVSINKEVGPYLKQRPGMWSYSVLFHNDNYPTFAAWLQLLVDGHREVVADRDVILVVNEAARHRQEHLGWADAVIYFPDECVKRYEQESDALLAHILTEARRRSGALFLIAGGPLAKWAVYALHAATPHNFYIDVGSSIDLIVRGQATRSFHTSSVGHVCSQV